MGKGVLVLSMHWMGTIISRFTGQITHFQFSGFNYDKLNALEIRALAVLEAFQLVKVKDLLHMAGDPEQISNFLGNAYICFFYCFLITLLFYTS